LNTLERDRPAPSAIYRPEPPRRRLRPLRLLFRLAGLCLLLALAYFGYNYVANKAFRQTVGSVVMGANPKRAFGTNAVTLLVLGKDEDRDNRDRVLRTNARSDTIILARLDFDAHTIDMLSIPRDTRVRVPGYRGYHKINAAHAIGGWEKTDETIREFLGVSADKVLVVDYAMLRRVNDAMGGVTVNVDKQLDYDDNWGNLHIHLKPGVQTLNGTEAMGYVRFRHSNTGAGDSDFVRIQRQQELVHAVKAKIKDPSTWVRAPRILETVRRQMRGNITYPQLVALASFARSVPKESVKMHVLPARSGRAYVYPDREAARALAARLFPTGPVADSDTGGDVEPRRTRRTRRVRSEAPPAPAAATATAPDAAPTPILEAAPEPAPEPEVLVEEAPENGSTTGEESAGEVLLDAGPAMDVAPPAETAPVPAEPATGTM